MRGPGQENFCAGTHCDASVFMGFLMRGGRFVKRPYETTIEEAEKRSEKRKKKFFCWMYQNVQLLPSNPYWCKEG